MQHGHDRQVPLVPQLDIHTKQSDENAVLAEHALTSVGERIAPLLLVRNCAGGAKRKRALPLRETTVQPRLADITVRESAEQACQTPQASHSVLCA